MASLCVLAVGVAAAPIGMNGFPAGESFTLTIRRRSGHAKGRHCTGSKNNNLTALQREDSSINVDAILPEPKFYERHNEEPEPAK